MIPKKNLFITSRAIQGKFYLINKYDAYLLGPIEQFIWECIDGKTPMSEITKNVANQYNENPDTVESEIEEFINSLLENNLIKN